MTADLRELVRRTYAFSCSHESLDGIFGHNYLLDVVYELPDPVLARAAEARIQKDLIDHIHSRDLSADRTLFGAGNLLDDTLIARTLARKTQELAAPVKLVSVTLRRNDKEAIEIEF